MPTMTTKEKRRKIKTRKKRKREERIFFKDKREKGIVQNYSFADRFSDVKKFGS